ncbi:glycoside hydrolase family 97 protein [Pseudoduganella sp. FT25W]|uniref:Glycoside hydrolase family 97 protein n=1 Tax=Duganella alba TaxID=2666081 RepID=A0A6L5QHK0_9BURK|nr:glycoside hydrolase family 97 protein [Duganella alba]MRX08461.1 glycoside hydrolase family 97 protein [Duganella alba]MRX17065.1 glycoside hydrolase family 97 protein [Duganella alba]
MADHIRAASLLALAFAAPAWADIVTVKSPDGRNAISVDSDKFSYSVSRDGKRIIEPSPLGLNLDIGALAAGARLRGHAETSVQDTYEIVLGKARSAPDHYNQSDIAFAANGKAPQFQLLVRAYDNGVAFRYAVPEQAGLSAFKVMNEATQFNFAKDYDCWGANMGRFDTSFEAEYDLTRASKIRNFHNFIAPLVCKTGAGATTFAIAESDVKDYPGFYLSGRGDAGLGVMVTLPPRFDNSRDYRFRKTVSASVQLKGQGFQTPWRVLMLGDAPGDLAASSLIPTLAAPSQIQDTSWIKPAKTSWDWWNDWAVNVPNAGINTATYKAFVDFSKEMKLDDILIDEGWSVGSDVEPNPQADVTKAKPAMDMPDLLRYARSQGVGVWLWVQWQQLDSQMDAAFAQYEDWGIKGVKVDFMNRNDQEMVDWYHKVLSKAAAHHLMVDLHGAYPPNGLNRTWPNYVTQEGVLGAENNKWSARITATHNVTLPFTRMILGPMDYTPGGFHNATPSTFVQRNHEPMVMTTRGQAVAMYVVYDSPFQMVSDSPAAYKNADGKWADGAEFIQAVPTSWDETRIVAGDIGEYIVSARRKGDVWYIGAMTNESGRTLKVPLSFLGKGAYHAHLLQDGDDASHLSASDSKVTATQIITLKLAPSGGAVAIIKP